jgi:hypothetical protein
VLGCCSFSDAVEYNDWQFDEKINGSQGTGRSVNRLCRAF